jgi:CBS domain-containing protein
VLTLLAHKGVHRVPVVDRETGRITKLITQSAVTKWLIKHPEAVSVLGDETVGHSSMGLCNVLTLNSEAPAVRALEILASSKLSGVCHSVLILLLISSC